MNGFLASAAIHYARLATAVFHSSVHKNCLFKVNKIESFNAFVPPFYSFSCMRKEIRSFQRRKIIYIPSTHKSTLPLQLLLLISQNL